MHSRVLVKFYLHQIELFVLDENNNCLEWTRINVHVEMLKSISR